MINACVVGLGGRGYGTAERNPAIVFFLKAQTQDQAAMMLTAADGNILIRALRNIFAIQGQNPAAAGAGGLEGFLTGEGFFC